ncbi:hypothetical protein RRF57_007227 [Xylaria bambusicola]|uniref:Uncharacterized protein n=1 Tax=Xylaria bambusicola TaxID=326684 RepID=A0AAN7UKT0_9PEZI
MKYLPILAVTAQALWTYLFQGHPTLAIGTELVLNCTASNPSIRAYYAASAGANNPTVCAVGYLARVG